MAGLSAPPGLTSDQGLTGAEGLSVGDGLSFQQFGPAGKNGILLEDLVNYLMLEDGISLLLQE